MGVLSQCAPDALAASRYRFFWRLHCWAGIITAPILLAAATTALIYVFTPQIEARLYRELDVVQPHGVPLPLERQIAAAQVAMPQLSIRTIIPAHQSAQTTQVIFGERSRDANARVAPSAAVHDHASPSNPMLYIDPYSGAVVGMIDERDRFRTWAQKLHSTLLQGEGWRWIIELGASWRRVMLMSGIYLWWPKSVVAGGRVWRALLPRFSARAAGGPRFVWRDWHSFTGIASISILLIVLITGLTWSKYTGENFRAGLNAVGQSSPRASDKLQSMRASPDINALNAALVLDIAKTNSPTVQLQLAPPKNETGVWRVSNYDRSQPMARVQLVINQYSGEVLYRSGWEDLPVGAKAVGVGIPFHRGEFGWWNQALLVFAALATIFSVISGVVMWWKRRPAGRIAAPATTRNHIRAVPWWWLPIALALSYVMPVFGISLGIFVAMEITRLLITSRIPGAPA